MSKVDIGGIQYDNITLSQAVKAADFAILQGRQTVVHTPNAEIAQHCIEDSHFASVIGSAEMILPDGAGIILASEILGTPIAEKVAGVVFGEQVLMLAAQKGYRIYFLGGKPGVAEKAAELMKNKYSGLQIVGTADGYFDKSGAQSDAVISTINQTTPDILFVCLGSPVQELWTKENRDRLNAKLILCLGGSLDIYAGVSKRAPRLFIALGLEWFWRLLKEPKRIGRMMKLPLFIINIFKLKITNGKKEKDHAC